VSEELIAEALYPYPKDLVITTKGGLIRTGPEGAWPRDGRPEHLREALHGSLQRLKLDRIDIYQYHRPDEKVPFEVSVGELAKLQAEGKIKHVALSNVTLDELARAQKIVPIVTVQNRYNLADRTSERMSVADSEKMINVCAQQNIGFIPWGPLTLGSLADSGRPLAEIAKKHEATPNQVILAWMLQRSSSMLPIPGTGSVKHLEENTAGATLKLSQEEFDAIDKDVRP
jgi:aryl-alcohol dehydrogenase-like predicted oxidoreductase